MDIIINDKKYECRAVTQDIDKITVYYGTYTDDGIENKTDIIGSSIIEGEGEVCYTIDWLKKQLTDTDYVIIKIAEGAATTDEYADVIAQRQVWREAINLLKA